MAEQLVGFWLTSNDNICQFCYPSLFVSPPNSCLIIMLLCVCLSVCLLCVIECVCSYTHCANVCSSNTGFSPSLSPTYSPLLLSPLMVVHSPLLNFPNDPFIYSLICTFAQNHTLFILFLANSHFICTSINSTTHSFWFPSPNSPHQPPSSFYFLPISDLLLFLFSSSLTLSTSFSSSLPSSLPLSLFHTVLCASLSLAGLLLGG